MDNNQEGNKAPTAFLVDLVSNRKIPIATPRCRVGRDDLNDIVISGDQSISRFHFIISYENNEFTVQDAKSRHGTFLNGNQLTVSEPIKDGDVLKVGVSLFWFVVEGAQSLEDPANAPNAGRVNAITDDEKAAAADAKVSVKSGGDMETTMMPTQRNQEMTQEMAKLDSGLMDKLEQAANTIKMDEKPEPRASLASLLADARAHETPESDKKKEELAALAARDKELLEQAEDEASSKSEKQDEFEAEPIAPVEEAAEAEQADQANQAEEAEQADKNETAEAGDIKEEDLPAKPINKPSDTVTLEALNPPAAARAGDDEEDREETVTSTQLDGIAEASSQSEESSDINSVSKQADSEPADQNTGIIESARESKEEAAQEKSEAKSAEKVISAGELAPLAERVVSFNPPLEPAHAASSQVIESSLKSGEFGSNGTGASKNKNDRADDGADSYAKSSRSSSDSQEQENSRFIKAGANAVPDWCKRYFSDEIAQLNHELDELNEQVKIAQQKIRDVETRVALTRGIRNTLLTTTGDELVEACGKVLSLLGWKVTITAEDKHELRLEVEDKHVCIARVIWTTTKAERSHLGQLSISQTRYWMEKGVEPKGIIIVSKISGEAPSAVGDSPEEIELNDYAAKRNVCLMSTLQLLSLYKEIALADASPDKLRASIVNASGWLAGHNLEPGTADIADEDNASSQSTKLGSLASA